MNNPTKQLSFLDYLVRLAEAEADQDEARLYEESDDGYVCPHERDYVIDQLQRQVGYLKDAWAETEPVVFPTHPFAGQVSSLDEVS